MTEQRPKINFHIINTTPHPICDVKFQYNPFYKTIWKIQQPMAVYCVPTAKSVLDQKLDYTLFELKFGFHEEALSAITRKIKNAQLQIRFGKEEPGMNELSEGLPEPLQISINSHKVVAKDSPVNYNNCATFLKLSIDKENKISTLWPHCKTPYYMMVNIVEILTIEDLVKQVEFNIKNLSMKLNTKAKAMEILKKNNNSDVEFNDSSTLKLSLLCPITKLKMKLPSRSNKCSHLQCFDLRSFFSMNLIKPTWKCPVCTIPIRIDQLVLDSFLLDIINSSLLPENCFQIMIFKNGNWEPYIEPKVENVDDQSESDIEHSKNTSFTVDSGNYNDENLRDEKNILPKTN